MELTKNVEISIVGTQYFSAADLILDAVSTEGETPLTSERTVELCTGGTLCATPEGISVTYEETPADGAAFRTIFTLEEDVMCLHREGDVQSHLVFEDGKRHLLYGDGQSVPVCVACHSLRHNLTQEGGKIDVEYSVEVAGSMVESGAYSISVRA